MNFEDTGIELARELDIQDELSHFRDAFVISEPDLIYLDGNSLGRLPKSSLHVLQQAIDNQWGERLIRSWNEGWMQLPQTLGAKIAKLIGAQPDEVLVSDATSVNLFKLATAALRARPTRNKIVSDVFNFPSDLYIFQGIVDLLGGDRRLELVPSTDGLSIAQEDLVDAIDGDTALVSLSHVAFKSAFLYDMVVVTELAHQAGALVLWDLSHSAGAVPVDLNGSNADLAIGCTYKYLNGGPGAPAFLYVRRDLQSHLSSPMWGWFAAQAPFEFGLDFVPRDDISRFQVGTPPVLSMQAIEPAVDILLNAGIGRLRHKSVMQSEYLIYLAEQWLLPLGFRLGSPRQVAMRGSHVSLRHPEGYRINRAMIDPLQPGLRVIPDFRAPDNIRLGIAPLYNSFVDIWRSMARIRAIVVDRHYENYSNDRFTVT
jgi:kynureninase